MEYNFFQLLKLSYHIHIINISRRFSDTTTHCMLVRCTYHHLSHVKRLGSECILGHRPCSTLSGMLDNWNESSWSQCILPCRSIMFECTHGLSNRSCSQTNCHMTREISRLSYLDSWFPCCSITLVRNTLLYRRSFLSYSQWANTVDHFYESWIFEPL